MGLDVYLRRNDEAEEADSKTDPAHLFKRGYFRSSYNGGGFNAAMERAGCPDLYAIFQPPRDGGMFTPDWSACLDRATSALAQYREHSGSPAGHHYVTFIDARANPVTSEREALLKYAEQASRPGLFHAYSNSAGHFWMEGAKLKAVIPGTRYKFEGAGVYLVFEQESEEGRDWYETALLIVIETIDYVLESGASSEFSLYWSA